MTRIAICSINNLASTRLHVFMHLMTEVIFLRHTRMCPEMFINLHDE